MVQKATNPTRALEEFKRIAERRHKMAMDIYNAQDNLTKEVIDRICDRLVVASTGVVSINGRPYKLENKYTDFNILFLACEILSDLAMLDIQIANFKPSNVYCASCKKKILKVPDYRKKKSRRG